MAKKHLVPCTTAAVISGILTRRGDVCRVTAFNALKSTVRCIFLFPFNSSPKGNYTPWVIALALLDPGGSLGSLGIYSVSALLDQALLLKHRH